MDVTPNLAMPYILASQAQKHVTHNEAIRMLDAIVQLAVADRDSTEPPSSPADGERHIVASGATGAWAGHDGKIAARQDGAWAFLAPREGWTAWVVDEQLLLAHESDQWRPASFDPGMINPAAMVGVNATADATNKLSVKSDAVLHSHDDVTPGSGDARHLLNKQGEANTASFLFQTGFSGRAEFGLTGDDDWHVKVSADGSNWTEALVADRSSGDLLTGGSLAVAGGLVVGGAQIDFGALPTSDPAVTGRLWNDNGALRISAG